MIRRPSAMTGGAGRINIDRPRVDRLLETSATGAGEMGGRTRKWNIDERWRNKVLYRDWIRRSIELLPP